MPPELARTFGKLDTRVELVQQWIAGVRHLADSSAGQEVGSIENESPCSRLCLATLEHALLAHLQESLRVEMAKELNERGHQAGPAGLVAGAQSGTVVPLEVL